MTRMVLASVSEVPKDGMLEKVVDGRTFVLAYANGKIKIMDGLCTHRQGHLAKGVLKGSIVKCPKHGAEYDFENGKAVRQPRVPLMGGSSDLKTYTPIIEGDNILINI